MEASDGEGDYAFLPPSKVKYSKYYFFSFIIKCISTIK